MKQLRWGLAAVAALAIAAPSLASAETTVIKKFDRGGPRAEMRMHRDHGMHRGWHRGGDKVVIIKRGHRHHHW